MGTMKTNTRTRKASPKKGRGKIKKMPAVCEYTMGVDDDDDTMTLECKSCSGPHAIEDKCLGPLISAFSKEYDTKKITMSHYIEKQYYGTSVTLLSKITYLGNELENLSLRDPVKEYFSRKAEKDRRSIACGKCGLNPSKLFSKMHIIVMKSLPHFYEILKTVANKIPAFKKKTRSCGTCLNATAEDLNHIFDEYEKIVGFISINAFNVMLQGNRGLYPGMPSPQILEQYLSSLMGHYQGVPGTHPGMGGDVICKVCMYPLKGTESNCPNCGTRLAM